MTDYVLLPEDHCSRLELKLGIFVSNFVASGLPQSMRWPTGKGTQARSSVRSPGRDTKCGKHTLPKGRVITGVQCDTCSKWFHCVFGSVKKDIYELCCKYDKLSWVWEACKKPVRDSILLTSRICHWQTLPKVDGRGR